MATETETTEDQTTEEGNDEQQTESTEDEELNEGGKKALEAERKARRDAEARTKALQKALDDERKKSMSDDERTVEEAKAAGRAEVTAKVNGRLFAATVQNLINDKVADPSLFADPLVAQRLLGFEELPVDDEGVVDDKAVQTKVEAWLKNHPGLAKPTRGSAGGPQGKPVGEKEAVNDWIRKAAGR